MYGAKHQRQERPYKNPQGISSFKAVVDKLDSEKGVLLQYEVHSEWIPWDRIVEPSRDGLRAAWHRGYPTTIVIRRGA